MKPFIAITVGDYNGIGPEVAIKAASARKVREICIPLLIGPWKAFEYYGHGVSGKPARLFLHDAGEGSALRIKPGKISGNAGKTAAGAIRTAVQLVQSGGAAAIVTSPVSKEALHRSGILFDGQTEYLAHLTRASRVAMLLVSQTMRVGLVTIHKPLRDVPRIVTREFLEEKIRTISDGLRKDFGIRRPRLAVLGMNPHAGEAGSIGDEEQKTITPVLQSLRKHGLRVEGPFPADSFFSGYRHEKHDAVIAMYHDQGLIPLKMSRGVGAVNVTLGLPIIRTSPDHGTAFNIAGKGIADPASMVEAIKLAVAVAQTRNHRGVA